MSGSAGGRRLLPQALILAAATGLVVVMLVLSLWGSWREALDEQQQRVAQFGGAVALHVQGELTIIDRALADVVGLARDEAGLAGLPGRRIPARVAALARVSKIDAQFAVQDPRGILIATSDAEVAPRIDLSDRPHFSRHREGGAAADDALFIAPPDRPFTRPESRFVLSRAIRSDTEGLLGVVSAAVARGKLLQEFEALRQIAGFDVGVFHRDGFALWGEAADEQAASVAAFDMAPGTARGVSPITTRVALAFKTAVPAYSLVLVVSRDIDAVARSWLERNRPRIAIYCGILILVFVLNVGLFLIIRRHAALEHRAQASLESRFRDGIESMGEVFMLWDADDHLIAWNRRTTVLGPLTAEILRLGLPFAEYVDRLEAEVLKGAEDPGRVRAYYQQRRERRLRLGEPFESGLLDGRILSGVERATSDGGIVTVIRDATEERRAVRRLAASEAQFRDFGKIASDWFWETGPDHRYSYYSRSTGTIVFDPDKVLGRTRIELVEAAGMAVTPALRELASIMDRHEVFRGYVIESRYWQDKTPCVLEVSGKPLFDESGAFLGYRGVGRDITLHRQQAAELERALAAEREMNLQQRRFVSIASHEFRTPLAVIDGATQRIMVKIRDAQPDVTKRLWRIRSAVSRMTDIIDRTLSSARMDDGRMELRPRSIELGALLREACERQRQISPGYDIVQGPIAGEPAIEADPKLLDQVITNLLSNAVKYSGASRRVEVLVTESGPSVEIAVRDFGVGVPEAEIPKLFTRFFRASTAEGISGTGIGLHLIRELVLLHGGSVEVVSQLGRGSTFIVRLPRRQAASSTGAAA